MHFAESTQGSCSVIDQYKPAVLILDIALPDLNAETVVKNLRAANSDALVIVHTNASSGSRFRTGKKLAADAILIKEPSLAKLVDAVCGNTSVKSDPLASPSSSSPPITAKTNEKSILLLDDDPVQHKLLSQLFAHDNNIKVICTDSIFILSEIKRHRVELALIDVGLPGIRQGDDIARFMRSTSAVGDVRVLLYSSRDESTLRRLVQETKANGYIQKTSDHEKLRSEILAWLN